jgi:hypothetical protein
MVYSISLKNKSSNNFANTKLRKINAQAIIKANNIIPKNSIIWTLPWPHSAPWKHRCQTF